MFRCQWLISLEGDIIIMRGKCKMTLGIPELKSAAALVTRARVFLEDALSIAENGGDVAVTARVKTLLFRARDVEKEIDSRLAAAEKAERRP